MRKLTRRSTATVLTVLVGLSVSPAKLERLLQLYEDAAAAFDADPEAAKPLAADQKAYALAIVANAMLNLDDLLTK